MGSLRAFLGSFLERRKHVTPVLTDRRRPRTLKDADAKLHESIRKLDEATRPEIPPKREVANDIQQTVQFSTFRDICDFSGSHELIMRLCKHKKHPAANTGMAKCSEELCPIMRGEVA